jgi:hypothetical protein
MWGTFGREDSPSTAFRGHIGRHLQHEQMLHNALGSVHAVMQLGPYRSQLCLCLLCVNIDAVPHPAIDLGVMGRDGTLTML